MVLLIQQRTGAWNEHLHQVRYLKANKFANDRQDTGDWLRLLNIATKHTISFDWTVSAFSIHLSLGRGAGRALGSLLHKWGSSAKLQQEFNRNNYVE